MTLAEQLADKYGLNCGDFASENAIAAINEALEAAAMECERYCSDERLRVDLASFVTQKVCPRIRALKAQP